MADGKVTVELSVRDADALAAWQRGKEGIGAMEKELQAAKRTTGELAKATAEATKKQADGWRQLSSQGKRLYDDRAAWSRGLKTLDDQRAAAAKKAADEQAAAQQKIAAEEKQIAAEADKAARAQARAAKSQESLGKYLKGQLKHWASYATAVGAATKAVTALVEANKKVRGEEADVTFTLDTQFRRLQVQGQMDDTRAAAARAQVFDIAERQAAAPETVALVAKQLISSGFDTGAVIEGGIAEEMVKGMQASAMKGDEQASPEQFTEAVTQFLLAQTGKQEGEQLSAGEQAQALSFDRLSQAVRETQGLFLRRNIQFADLGELAKAAPALSRAGLDMTTQLAAFTKMRDVLDAEEAATALRNIAVRMQTSGASKEKTAALAEIGLTPADIDMEGESFEEALSRLRDALANAGPAKQAEALKKLFEERGGLGASVLIQNVEDIAKYRREATDTSAFDLALKNATEGFAAGKRREETQKQRQRFGGQGARDALVGEAIEIEYSQAGHPVKGAIRRQEYNLARSIGIGESRALTLIDLDRELLLRIGRRVKQAQSSGINAAAPAAAPKEPDGEERFKASFMRAAREQQYAARAAAFKQAEADEAAAKERQKVEAAAARARQAGQSSLNREGRAADAAGKAADSLAKQAEADAKQVAELRAQLDSKRRISRVNTRRKATATQIREQESTRRLEVRLAEAEQKKREHEAAAQRKREEQNTLLEKMNTTLAEIARNTRTGGGFTPAYESPQRPPPTIGGN